METFVEETDYLDFKEVKQELLRNSKTFDAGKLRLIPYSQLILCCTGEAAEARCSVELVAKEKTFRRERFLAIPLKECQTYLKLEGLYEDVKYHACMNQAPSWEELNPKQQLWAKMVCLLNHPDRLEERFCDIRELIRKSGIPLKLKRSLALKISHALKKYRDNESWREFISTIAGQVYSQMSPLDKKVVLAGRIRNFRCTSNCFRVPPL